LRGEPNIDDLVAEGLQLGEGVHIGRPVVFDRAQPWLITIGDHAVIGMNAVILTHDISLRDYTGQARVARVDIGARVIVGAGAIILPGTKIGDDSVIGAGAVVRGDIPPRSLAVGNPAKVSELKAIVAWQRASAKKAPHWPTEGWSRLSITDERRREQREALAGGVSGYVPARPSPGSPFFEQQQKQQAAATPANGSAPAPAEAAEQGDAEQVAEQ
jgi:maltose O-acetyltransferase